MLLNQIGAASEITVTFHSQAVLVGLYKNKCIYYISV